MIHTELNIQREQRANALLILFPCLSLLSPVVQSTRQSDTSKRWWPIVNNPVSNSSRRFSERAVLWRRKGTGCYGIRLWLLGCGKQRALCFRRMHGCKQEALQGTAESLGFVQYRGRNLLKQAVVASMELSRHSVFGFPESTSFSPVTDSPWGQLMHCCVFKPLKKSWALKSRGFWKNTKGKHLLP